MMEIGEAGLAYHYQHEYEEQCREIERKSGIGKIKQGTVIAAFSAVFFPFSRTLFFFVLGAGILVFFIGVAVHSTFEKSKISKKENAERPHIQLHHQPVRIDKVIVTKPQRVLRHSLNHIRLYFDSGRHSQIALIKKTIKENTGSTIDTVYHIYKLEGGSFGHEEFAKAVRFLEEHGSVRANRVLSFVDAHNEYKPLKTIRRNQQ